MGEGEEERERERGREGGREGRRERLSERDLKHVFEVGEAAVGVA